MQRPDLDRIVLAFAVIILLMAAGLGFSLVSGYYQARDLCDFQRRSWTIQHQQILDDAVPNKPTEAVLRAFPEIRPFYEPGNPLYDETVRSLNKRRDRRLAVLGGRPEC